MDCERVKGLLSDYLDGTIPESDLAEVDDHLRRCSPCASEAEGLKETVDLLHALPRVKAPPELLEKVRMEIARDTDRKPLWKKIFLPAHVKIPLEAAAVAALFLLVVATQREQAPREIPSSGMPAGETAIFAGKEKGTVGGPAAASPDSARTSLPRGEEIRARAPRKAEGAPSPKKTAAREGSGVPAPAASASPRQVESRKPADFVPIVPAQRISTDAGRIDAGRAEAEKEPEGDLPRLFAAPPSRLLQPVPFGRPVTLEVTRENREGIEERIAAAALKLGGSFARVTLRTGTPDNISTVEQLRVQVPSESADTFLAELSRLGTLPQEGMSSWADLPAGPSPGIVAYAVRIRVK